MYLKAYLDDGGDPLVVDPKTQATLLHAAGMLGDVDLCQRLVETGLSKTLKDRFGNIPFNYVLLGLTERRKRTVTITDAELTQFGETLRQLYSEQDCGLPIEDFLGRVQ